MFPFYYDEKNKEKEKFVQEYLYIEEPIPMIEKDIDNNKKEQEVERGVVVIDIL